MQSRIKSIIAKHRFVYLLLFYSTLYLYSVIFCAFSK